MGLGNDLVRPPLRARGRLLLRGPPRPGPAPRGCAPPARLRLNALRGRADPRPVILGARAGSLRPAPGRTSWASALERVGFGPAPLRRARLLGALLLVEPGLHLRLSLGIQARLFGRRRRYLAQPFCFGRCLLGALQCSHQLLVAPNGLALERFHERRRRLARRAVHGRPPDAGVHGGRASTAPSPSPRCAAIVAAASSAAWWQARPSPGPDRSAPRRRPAFPRRRGPVGCSRGYRRFPRAPARCLVRSRPPRSAGRGTASRVDSVARHLGPCRPP